MFIKMTFSNGLCGCTEEIYRKINDNWSNSDLADYAEEYLRNYYSYYEDDRFIDSDNCETEEEYVEAYAEYQDNCYYDYEECTEEEYMDNGGEEV